MLTKDLVRYQISRDRIDPDFLPVDDDTFRHTAAELLSVFSDAVGMTRAALADAVKPIIDAVPFPAVIARGMEKLLLDRTVFETAADEALTGFRQQLFAKSAALLSTSGIHSQPQYQEAMAAHFQQTAPDIEKRIYADLPEFQPVVKFKSFSPERLLHRYNVAQVQALLLRCSELQLTIRDASPAALRQLFKYLRFRQLLADIRKDDSGDFQITVDGPLNLFYKSQKYGMNLALFFPAVLHQTRWTLTARVRFVKRREHLLQLDETSGLAPYSHQFLAYVPEEITMFQETFRNKLPDWRIDLASHFIPLAGEAYCFPDFVLSHSAGGEIALELFHPWHASHLQQRLRQLSASESPTLLLGIAKPLLKDPAVQDSIDESSYFEQYGFVFREMPTVAHLKSVLQNVLNASAGGV